MLNIKKPTDPIDVSIVKVLIYGPPGVGKTTFGLSAPKPLLLDFDGGLKRVQPKDRTDSIPITDWSEVDNLEDPRLADYDSLVIDTAGKALELLSADIIKTAPPKTKLSYNGNLTQQGYGVLKNRFIQWLIKANAVKKNLIFIAHHKEEKDGETSIVRPDVQGKSSDILMREMDLVGYMSIVEGRTVISFDPTEKYYGKNTCNLDPLIDSRKTGLTAILDVYHGNQGKRNELIVEYNKLRDDSKALIDAMTPETLLDTGKALKAMPAIWDSKLQINLTYWEKVKELGFKWNGTTFEAVADEPLPMPK